MFSRIKNWFKHEVHVIEVEKGTVLPALTEELKASLRLLRHNPAFDYLVQKARFEKATLEGFLKRGYDLSEKEIARLQAGIHWLGYLEQECVRLGAQEALAAKREALSLEAEAFHKIHSAVEVLAEATSDNR